METHIKPKTLDQIVSWWQKQTHGKFNLAHYLEICRVRAIIINQEQYNETVNTKSN